MKNLKRVLLHLFFSIAIIIGTLYSYTNGDISEYFKNFDSKFIDLLFQSRGVKPADSRVVIVDIDEKSLSKLGQWPWQREKIAQILYNLANKGAGIIGFDIVFAEPDNSSPAKVLNELGIELENAPDFDAILAQMIANTPTITGYVFNLTEKLEETRSPVSQLPHNFLERNPPEGSKDFIKKAKGIVLNTPIIQDNSYSSGFFNTIPDDDGIVRNVPLVMMYNGVIYPSLSFELIRVAHQKKFIPINYNSLGIESIEIGDIVIPTDPSGRLFVNYRGPRNSYKYLSAIDIYNDNFDAKDVEGNYILIGTSAAGLLDLRATPFESVYPGVEVHANVIDNIINSDFISKPIESVTIDIFAIIITSILISTAMILLPPLYGGALSIITYAGFYYFITYMFETKGIILTVIFPLISMTLILLLSLILNYFFEAKQKEQVKAKFAQKVSPAVMDDLLKNMDSDVFSAHEREITVFFSDVRNFTNISEAMGNPKNLINFMNSIMNPMTDIIIKTGGTVDKFIGDAIMAYWNAPLDVEDHADKAVIATLEQLHKLKSLNKSLRENPDFENVVKMSDRLNLPIVDIGIGLNTGVAIVGEMGSTGRSDYTAIGDPINLGARLESLCKYYNSKLNISNFTKEKLKGNYIYRFLDLVTVKGKSEPIEIWQIHDYEDQKEDTLYEVSYEQLQRELHLYNEAIKLYKMANFQEALDIFKDIENWDNKTNKNIYKIYIERCEHYIKHPPKDFNGVFVHTTKG